MKPVVKVKAEKKKRTRVRDDANKIKRKNDLKKIASDQKEIKKYEKLLKLKSFTKRNKLPKSFYLDGLGELLEICDNKEYKSSIKDDSNYKKVKRVEQESSEDECSNSDNEDDYKEEEDDENFDNDGEDFEEEGDDNFDDDEVVSDHFDEAQSEDEKNEEDMNEENEDEDLNEEDDEDLDNEEGSTTIKRRHVALVKENGFYEDIYGFLRDPDGNIVHDESESAENKLKELNDNVVVDDNLQRRIRGLLNRLAASNIKVISGEIINLYRMNSRFVVNKGIYNIIQKIVINIEYQVPCTLVSELAMLISILYTDFGEEIGGFFVHFAIKDFDSVFNDIDNWNQTKKLRNIVIFLLNLNATGLLDSEIIYDILDKFVEKFPDPLSIELVDLTLKSIGFTLRKDNANRMKNLILRIQNTVGNLSGDSLTGSRFKFILESLKAIKNNNVAKLKVNDPVVMSELIESTLKGVIKKNRVPCISGLYATVIQSSHWFSFTKNIVALDAINVQKNDSTSNTESELLGNHDPKINLELRDKLCRVLRINTPLRKDLFTALFMCNDYIEAAHKLISVGKKQFSEVINLVLHVALNEKTYNPFYLHLLQHISSCDRKYKVKLFDYFHSIGLILVFIAVGP